VSSIVFETTAIVFPKGQAEFAKAIGAEVFVVTNEGEIVFWRKGDTDWTGFPEAHKDATVSKLTLAK